MKIFQKIKSTFLTKEERLYLKEYQKKYHKLSLKEKLYLIKLNREYESSHFDFSEEEKANELMQRVYDYFGIDNDEKIDKLIKDEDEFVSIYESKYGKVNNVTFLKMEYAYLKEKYSLTIEECLEIIHI